MALDFGFGDELMEGGGRASRLNVEPLRGPVLAEAEADAWCSFCCRPGRDAGTLVSGSAGAYLCRACAAASAALLGEGAAPSLVPTVGPSAEGVFVPRLPSQRRALEQLARRTGRVVLLVGPPASGKSALLRSLAPVLAAPFVALPEGSAAVDVTGPLASEDLARLLAWLEGGLPRRLFLAATGVLPEASVVLTGPHGAEALFDTRALQGAVPSVGLELLAAVDQVLPFDSLSVGDLEALALGLLEARGVSLSAEALHRIGALAEASGRGAHELTSLVGRLGPGRYVER